MGSVCDKKETSNRNGLCEENFEDIQTQRAVLTHKLLRCLKQETGVSLGSAFTVTKLIEFCLYKVMYVHELKKQVGTKCGQQSWIHICYL
jgi:hypothetical protein